MTKVCLLYPPQQTLPGHQCKPEASLAYPYLAGALIEAGHDVEIYDACVGNSSDSPSVFFDRVDMESGLQRHGVSDERILVEVSDCDVVGITSIFTAQETMAIRVGKLIKEAYPDKVLVAGGTNARSRPDVFLAAGFDVVCMSEGEDVIVQIANHPGEFHRKGRVTQPPLLDLDSLPMPAWHLHANDRYWKIGRPHGAAQHNNEPFAYANMMTSRGCIFRCRYCHISGEKGISKFRVKSTRRVQREVDTLRQLGVENVFLEDDSLFGDKQRGIDLLRQVSVSGLRMWDINGVNLCHLFKGRTPDAELLDVLQECRFTTLTLPVESANQRIINHYASAKWQVEKYDIAALISALSERGITTGVNYMIGYPDETLDEIQATLNLARQHMDAGAASANIMLVIPLPGTVLHDEALDRGFLDSDFDPDTFNWRRANMVNTLVPPGQLEDIQREAWNDLNGNNA